MVGWSRSLLIVLLAFAWPALAQAAVRIQFYSQDNGSLFPHAFVVLKGTLDSTGEKVDTNLGFSAVRVTPAMLSRSVVGHVEFGVLRPAYVARSTEHFAFTLTDEEYRAVYQVAEAWRTRQQPTYNLNTSNCVFFIGEVAQALKLRGEPREGLMKKPHSFLAQVKADSAPVLAQFAARQATLAGQPPVNLAEGLARPTDSTPTAALAH